MGCVCCQRLGGWLVECCFASTETVGLLGTGAQDGHLDFHIAPELCLGGEVDRCIDWTLNPITNQLTNMGKISRNQCTRGKG